jgi:hypothetical protein
MSDAQLKDLEAIRTLKALYAQRSDALFRNPGPATAAALAELFTEDGVLDLGPFGRFEGRATLLDAFENLLPKATAWSAHHITNPVIEVAGTSARGSWSYLIFTQPRVSPPPPAAPIFGGYEDRYEKVGGAWKIAESVASFAPPAT